MSAEDKQYRGQCKALVTRCIKWISRYIAEDNVSEVKLYIAKIKDAFQKFEEIHNKCHKTLMDDADIEASDTYFFEVQDDYVAALNSGKSFIQKAETHDDEHSKPFVASDGKMSCSEILNLVNLPKVELEIYHGDPLSYQTFIAMFDEHVGQTSIDGRMKLTRLFQYTSGKAKEAIRSCAMIPGNGGYLQARDILKERFGNHHIIYDAVMKKLRGGKAVKSASELQQLSDDLKCHFMTLESMGKLSEVDSQPCIIDIINRLQPYMRNLWKKIAMEEKRKTDRYPNFKDLVNFIAIQADEANDPVYGQGTFIKSPAGSKPAASCLSTNVEHNSSQVKFPCKACSGDHRLFYCDTFKSMRPQDRLKFVHENKLCENCLLSNHVVANCRKQSVCSVPGCGQKHTKFIHVEQNVDVVRVQNASHVQIVNNEQNVQELEDVNQETENNVIACYSKIETKNNAVRVPVVPVNVNNVKQFYALLDPGSTGSFCTPDALNALKVQGISTRFSLSTVGNPDVTNETKIVNFNLKSVDGCESLKLTNVYVVDCIPAKVPKVDVMKYPHFQGLSVVNETVKVDILIGQDHPEALIPLETRTGRKGDPYAVRTMFGWTINGPASAVGPVSKRVISHFVTTSQIESDIQKLWDIEHENLPHDQIAWSVEDKRVIELWDQKVEFSDGHYFLPIPWKSNVEFPNNITVAQSRLKSLRVKLAKQNLLDKYDGEISKLCEKGYAEVVPKEELSSCNKVWYLPHQAVISEKKPGKLRIVFDCSSKYQGQSLNDKSLQGPDVNNKLLNVLLRFRKHQIAIMADIEAMYYQVRLLPADRDRLRFLWIDLHGNLNHYRMCCHVFGGIWCASIATYALRRTLHDCRSVDPLVKDTILQSFYVDDCLMSVSTTDEARMVINGTKDLLGTRGFHLTKFIVNDEELLSEIPESDRDLTVRQLNSKSDSKALGIMWDVDNDHIYFDPHFDFSRSVTRRVVLSTVCSIFDPLGLINPVLITGRILCQEATRLKLGWDDVVPPDLKKSWCEWLLSLQALVQLRIPRCVKPSLFDDAHCELHHFSDANSQAYGCCSYLRCISKTGRIHVALLCSKSRVAPLKATTIPRLELQAAVLAARIDKVLLSELHLDLGQSSFWTDSEIVLRYIASDSRRFHVFVANRVSEIRNLTDSEQWSHIPGSRNPADLITRGCTSSSLGNSDWLEGPVFLRTHKSTWKTVTVEEDHDISNLGEEILHDVVIKVACATELEQSPMHKLFQYYSSWFRLKRALSWILRWKDLLLKRRNVSEISSPLTASDLRKAEVLIIKHVQGLFYESEIERLSSGQTLRKTSTLKGLSPFLNSEGLLCVGGRMKHAVMGDCRKYPIIIPHKHIISRMIILDLHNVAHLGTEWTLSLLRAKFWVTKARSLVKSVKGVCVTCKKLFMAPCKQRMADLPPERLTPDKPPFTFVGVDCFGPISVKLGRAEVKRYGCIFTCFSTRAVHLEKLDSMDTTSFLNAFRRFVARRGMPEKAWSDNGSNFLGARNELEKSLKDLKLNKIQFYCTEHDVDWSFIPPRAPHMGGVWERLVRTVKKVLLSIVRNTRQTDETLVTLFCEVENLVNSRPLTKVNDDPNDLCALTPNNLLLFKEGPTPPPGLFHSDDMYKSRWKYVQFLAAQFWKRWLKEYLPTLQSRHKWQDSYSNLKSGDLVLVADENTPRGLWPLGLIVDVNIGRDGLVRSARVKTACTVLVRPITKLVLLENKLC